MNAQPNKLLLVLSFFFALLVIGTGCKKTECEDEICEPCPSSRLIFQYQDSTGGCDSVFSMNARVHAFEGGATDTAYSYNFSDYCKAAFLVREGYTYHVVSGTTRDTVVINGNTYQDPISVTECCLCYPAKTVDIVLNGDSMTVDFPTGAYDSNPKTRTIN